MKVLIINSDYGSGSTGRIVREIKSELEKKHDSCIAFFGRENCTTDNNVFQIGNKMSVYSHVLMTRFGDKQGFCSTIATRNILKKVDEYHPDIINLHNLHGSYIDCNLLFNYIKEKKIPTLWTLHDCWSFTGHCSHYSFVNCSKWRTRCKNCPQMKEYPKSFIDRSKENYLKKKNCFTGHDDLKISTVSRWLQGEVQQSFLHGYDSVVIPNGIDLNIFKPIDSESIKNKLGLRGKRVLISVASVWGPRKGLGVLINIAKALGDDYRLILVGLKESAEDLPKNVIVIHRTDDIQELAQYYSAADVCINASVEETFGMVSLEALACGTPVITNSFTANPELVDKTCGVIVPEYTVEAYLKAINDEKVWNLKSSACVIRAENYSKTKMIGGYLDAYRRLV